jgi:UDP-2,4-diacetamido-2,4,6-trideoxy-beta-L-altropyranose hydrolase
VSRCVALAEELADAGWRVLFAVGSETLRTAPALAASGFPTTTIDGPDHHEPKKLEAICPGGADLMVVDHYGRDHVFEGACRSFARKVAVFDDCTGRRHDCDVLIDAAVRDADPYDGLVPAPARRLVGSAYALVRRELLAKRSVALARRGGPVRNILVSFGATDSANVTPRVLGALTDINNSLFITVALAARAPRLDDVRAKLGGHMQLVLDGDMGALISAADLAIGAAGSSAFERAALGLPSIILTVTDNQRGIAGLLTDAGAAVDGGAIDADFSNRLLREVTTLIADAQKRVRMAEVSHALVDGHAARRIRVALADTSTLKDGGRVNLRLAEAADEAWLLELQKISVTRRYARDPAVPSPDEHAAWMKRTLNDADILLLIVEIEGQPAAMIRLDRRKSQTRSFEVSIAVLPGFQGRGVATAGLNLAHSLCGDARIDAAINPQNAASQALFRRAGYKQVSDDLFSIIPGPARAGHHNAA